MKETMCEDMTFNEFVSWATGHVFNGLIVGGTNEMKNCMHTVIAQVCLNKVFGGAKK